MENRKSFRAYPFQAPVITLIAALILLTLGGVAAVRKGSVPIVQDGLQGRDHERGVEIVEVQPAALAHQIGIRRGDVLTAIDGVKLPDMVAYSRLLHSLSTDRRHIYTVERDGTSRNIFLRPSSGTTGTVLYFTLLFVGLSTLILGCMVAFFGRQPVDRNLFVSICLTLAAITIFSPVGLYDPLDHLLNAVDDLATVMLPLLFLFFSLVFPSGHHTLGQAWRRLSSGAKICLRFAFLLGGSILSLFVVWYAGVLAAPGNPFTTTSFYNFNRSLSLAWFGAGLALGGAVLLGRLKRTHRPIQRAQLNWVGLGALAGSLPPLVFYFIPYFAGSFPSPLQELSVFSLVVIPAAFARAVIKYGLADIQLVVKRSLVFSVSALLTFAVLLPVILLSLRWSHLADGPDFLMILLLYSGALLGISTLLFPKIQKRISRSADRIQYGEEAALRGRLAGFDPFTLDSTLSDRQLVEQFSTLASRALGEVKVHYLPGHDERIQDVRQRLALECRADSRCSFYQLNDPVEGCHQILAMRSRGNGSILGIIGFGPRKNRPLFSSEDLEILLPAAELMASALENRALNRRLAEQERLAVIGQLAAGVAHEINTPLTGISSYTEMLLESVTEDDQDEPASGITASGSRDSLVELLKRISLQADRAGHIVTSLLQYSRQDSGEPMITDLNEILAQAGTLFDHRLKRSAVTVSFSPSAEPLPVLADPPQLQQVAMNLMDNALDAMPGGGTLRVETGLDGSSVLLTVTDSGPGIDQSIGSRVFEPFFTTKPSGRGTGLGLAICYGIIRRHGGTITHKNHAKGGTVFTVTLPLAEDQTIPLNSAREG